MSLELPHFPYHRDPQASGSLRRTDDACECCGQSRGVLYDGVVYTRSKVKALCPWCIASGLASPMIQRSAMTIVVARLGSI